MRITEIYMSLQGESSWQGWPCTFVRLTGCHLRCRWCDTTYAFTGGRRMAIEEVLREVRRFPARLVEVTGGEPLLQREVVPLLTALCDEGYEVLVETSGCLDISPVDPRAICIMDVKCPDSGESGAMCWENLDRLRPRDEVKFVLASRSDYEWAREVIRRHGLEKRGTILLSAAHRLLEPRDIAEWTLADGLRARVQIQLHKHLWGAEARGV